MPMEAAKGYSITARGDGDAATARPVSRRGQGRDQHLRRRAADRGDLRSHRDGHVVAPPAHRRDGGASLPYLRDWRPAEVELEWSGLRPYPADGLPIIGPAPDRPGLVVATGHGRMGITLAPATGDAVARLVIDGVVVPEIEPFALAR